MKTSNMTAANKTTAPKRRPAKGAKASGTTITLPGMAGWYAATALELARLGDEIGFFYSETSPGASNSKDIEDASQAMSRLAEKFWRWAGEEISLFNAPEMPGHLEATPPAPTKKSKGKKKKR